MRTGDFRCDVEAEAEALIAGLARDAEERLKQALEDVSRDRVAFVFHSELENAISVARPNFDSPCSMFQRVAREIGQQLSYASGIAIDGMLQSERGFDRPIGPCGSQLVDHLFENGTQQAGGIAVQREPATQASARE